MTGPCGLQRSVDIRVARRRSESMVGRFWPLVACGTLSNEVAFATGDLPIRYMIQAGTWMIVIGLC